MLTQEQNDRLTQVGPGTPMGELMRRYWHPIAGSEQLNDDNPTREVRLLGEDLVLYRDASGTLGLIEPPCPHRKASMAYGIPEVDGLRCPYHGWLFNEKGECVEQPSEPAGSTFKDKVKIKAYKAQELGGLIFAYMGPDPAPVLPRWDILVWPGKRFGYSVELPCNWLQCQENSLDPLHFQWLHRYWGGWVMNQKKPQEERDAWNRLTQSRGADHRRIGFEKTDYGVIKRRLVGEETEQDDHWKIGHPVLFPNVLRVVRNLQFRVPIDDTHTLHVRFEWDPLPEGEEDSGLTPYEDRALYDEDGKIKRDYVMGQDMTAWVIQGPITDRTTERLGVSDVGLIMYRRLLEEQMKVVQDGGEPINVHREEKEIIVLPIEEFRYPGYDEIGGPFRDTTPRTPDVVADLSGAGARLSEWGS